MFIFLWMVIQVICEVLPISSSGHVQLFFKYAPFFGVHVNFTTSASDIDFFLQTVSAVVFLCFFFKSWWRLVVNAPMKLQSLFLKKSWNNIAKVMLFGLVVDGITAIAWFAGVGEISLPLTIGFMITAASLYALDLAWKDRHVKLWQLHHAVILGIVQGCSLLPGVSRFATTFVAMRFFGYKNEDALPISFLVEWPLIVAGGLKGLWALRELDTSHPAFLFFAPLFLFGMVIAGIVSLIILMWVKKIVEANKMWIFAMYMIFPICLAIIARVAL